MCSAVGAVVCTWLVLRLHQLVLLVDVRHIPSHVFVLGTVHSVHLELEGAGAKQAVYCKLLLAGVQQTSSVCQREGSTLVCDKNFLFAVPEQPTPELLIELREKKLLVDSSIGSCKLSLSTALNQGSDEAAYQLYTKGGQPAGVVKLVILSPTAPAAEPSAPPLKEPAMAGQAPNWAPNPSYLPMPSSGFNDPFTPAQQVGQVGHPPAVAVYPAPPPYQPYPYDQQPFAGQPAGYPPLPAAPPHLQPAGPGYPSQQYPPAPTGYPPAPQPYPPAAVFHPPQPPHPQPQAAAHAYYGPSGNRSNKLEEAAAAFRLYDTDFSGCLSFGEFVAALQYMGLKISIPDAQAIYATIDVNSDGEISQKEFVECYMANF
eukprot:jgi/Chlat1/3388/Chrsp23S03731